MRRGFFFVFLVVAGAAAWAGGRGEVETVTAEGGETWQYTFSISGRGKGTYNYIVNARDHAGNEAVSGPFNIKIDPNSGIPTVKVVYPEDGFVVRQNIAALGTAAGRFGISTVSVRLDNSAPVEAEGTEYWSRMIDFNGVPDGPHTLFFKAGDSKGTVGPELRVDFILDTSPPKLELVSHKIGDIISSDVKIKVRASDPNGIGKVEISEDGENYKTPDTLNQAMSSFLKALSIKKKKTNSVDFEFPIKTKDLTDGEKAYYVRAVDKTGAFTVKRYMFLISKNGSARGTGLSAVNFNTSVTSLVLNTPAEGEIITSPFEISGVAFGGVKSVHWRFLGPTLESITKGEAGREATEAARAFMANPDIPFNEASASRNISVPIDFTMISDGEYVCEVYVEDRDGVQSEIVSRTIKISTGAPETRIISPPITRYSSHVILVRGFTGDANGIENITISMDRGLTWQDVTLNDDGTWVLPLNTAIYTDRVYAASIIAQDIYGITSFSNAMINIDNTSPNVVITSPSSGQYVGTDMSVIGRVADNIELKSLTFHVISVVNPSNRIVIDVEPQKVIFETVSLANFTAGEYIVRILSKDLADNETIVSRKIFYDPYDINAQVAIYSPLPGEEHTGPVYVAGLVKGTALPETVQLMLDGKEFQELPVDRYGVFRYDISEAEIGANGPHKIFAYYKSEKGRTVASANHTVYYDHYGPILLIDSHRDGDVITNRPWLRGRAMFVRPPHPDGREYTRAEISQFSVSKVEVSYDNGRTFKQALGKGDWRWRLEPLDLPPGTQPVVVRATFENGEQAVRRVLLFIDAEHPEVAAVSPAARSVHRDEIRIFGAAGDNFELADVDVSLRPYHKFWYSVPPFIRGLYIDVKTLGATYFDVGVGLGFMDNNVRFQFQYGIAPPEEHNRQTMPLVSAGRYVGDVMGIKLLANIFTLPFDGLFKDRDWIFYKMKFAVGANFSWFSMDYWRSALYMGAVVAQIDLANVDMKYIYPNWKYFHVMALYLQPEVWFASTDAQNNMYGEVSKTIWRMTIGMRFNVF
ncbi:MAG: hypothetical protein LBU85_04280 [Treponema sp.]|jgi:hypothetical protein|nr:hypothetical protein [Treponema sp.]